MSDLPDLSWPLPVKFDESLGDSLFLRMHSFSYLVQGSDAEHESKPIYLTTNHQVNSAMRRSGHVTG